MVVTLKISRGDLQEYRNQHTSEKNFAPRLIGDY